MRLNFRDCEENIQTVINKLEKRWLEKQLEEIKRIEQSENKPDNYYLKFNPLAFRIAKAKEHLEICRKDKTRKITEEILRVALLGIHLLSLEKHQVKGLDKKIQLLMNDNITTDQLEQIIYEFSIASVFLEKAKRVEFVDPEKMFSKSPDLLVDEIEVECKKKDSETQRDRANNYLWSYLVTKLFKLMNSRQKNYFIYIMSDNEPQKEHLDKLYDYVKGLISNEKEGNFNFDGFEILAKKGFDFNKTLITDLTTEPTQSLKLDVITSTISSLNNTKIANLILNDKDYGMMYGESGITNNKVVFKNMKGIGCKSKILPDRIRSVENLLRTAKEQFTDTKPSIIFVELNFLTAEQVQNDFTRLEKIISSILRNNSRISSVVITIEGFPEDEEKIMYYQNAIEIRNLHPKYPLPNDFQIIDSQKN